MDPRGGLRPDREEVATINVDNPATGDVIARVDALEAVHDAPEILVLHHLPAEIGLDTVELVQNLFEPQLVGLVHDDEQHLIVRDAAVPRALRRLGG